MLYKNEFAKRMLPLFPTDITLFLEPPRFAIKDDYHVKKSVKHHDTFPLRHHVDPLNTSAGRHDRGMKPIAALSCRRLTLSADTDAVSAFGMQ